MGKIAEGQAGLRWGRYHDCGFTTIKHKTRAQDLVPRNNEVDAGGESLGVQGTLYAERDRNVINSAVWDEFVPEQHGLLPERQRRYLGRLGSRYTRRAGRSFGPVEEERHTLAFTGRTGREAVPRVECDATSGSQQLKMLAAVRWFVEV